MEARLQFLRAQPLCRICQSKGILRAAEEVDHIKALGMGGLDVDANKQPLCKRCHKEKTRAERARTGGAV